MLKKFQYAVLILVPFILSHCGYNNNDKQSPEKVKYSKELEQRGGFKNIILGTNIKDLNLPNKTCNYQSEYIDGAFYDFKEICNYTFSPNNKLDQIGSSYVKKISLTTIYDTIVEIIIDCLPDERLIEEMVLVYGDPVRQEADYIYIEWESESYILKLMRNSEKYWTDVTVGGHTFPDQKTRVFYEVEYLVRNAEERKENIIQANIRLIRKENKENAIENF